MSFANPDQTAPEREAYPKESITKVQSIFFIVRQKSLGYRASLRGRHENQHRAYTTGFATILKQHVPTNSKMAAPASALHRQVASGCA